MTLSFASAYGNLFNRLGKLGALISTVRTHQNNLIYYTTDAAYGITAQYAGEPDLQALMGASYIGVLDGAGGVGSLMQTIAAATVNRMVFRDQPLIAQTLQDLSVTASLYEVIRQMKLAGATILAQTVAATVPDLFTAASAPTKGTVVVSLRRPSDGAMLENAFAETLTITCAGDSYLSGTTAGNELFLATGTGSQSDVFAFNWPLGSDGLVYLNAIDGSSDTSAGNYLVNSGFDTYPTVASGAATGPTNVPSKWTLVQGTAGTHVIKETGIVFDGAASLRIVGGSTVELTQVFGSSDGTPLTLSPLTQYSFVVWARRDGTAAGAGSLTFSLIDSAGVVINDAASTPNTLTVDLTSSGTLSTVFQPYKVSFRTPHVMPSTYKMRLLVTGLTAGRSIYLDLAGLGEMQQLTVGGPFLSTHSGPTPFIQGDYVYVPITNSRGAGGSLDTFQTLLARLYPEVLANEILFPSAASPTILDADYIV